jgi:hypothetical protein
MILYGENANVERRGMCSKPFYGMKTREMKDVSSEIEYADYFGE